jgi:hypothetical protein
MRKRDGSATQNETVLAILRERGDDGVSAIELDRRFGIYRAGARIFDLRREGYLIHTKTEHGKTAHYTLLASPVGATPIPILTGAEQAHLWAERGDE